MNHIRHKWGRHKSQIPDLAVFVEKSLQDLAFQINQFSTAGLAASHNDICNANWLFASGGKIHVIDLGAMPMEDPALEMGTLLWWYYPPELRGQFLVIAGYPNNDEFKFRMRVRMSLHCLNIILPREQGFDGFQADLFSESLRDFKAVFAGKENPEGYRCFVFCFGIETSRPGTPPAGVKRKERTHW